MRRLGRHLKKIQPPAAPQTATPIEEDAAEELGIGCHRRVIAKSDGDGQAFFPRDDETDPPAAALFDSYDEQDGEDEDAEI